MNKIFAFLEKDARRNGYFALISLIICVISLFLCIFSWYFLVVCSLSFNFFIFFICFNKIACIRAALNEAQKYIEALENENKDYKMNVEVLLNDRDVRALMVKKCKKW